MQTEFELRTVAERCLKAEEAITDAKVAFADAVFDGNPEKITAARAAVEAAEEAAGVCLKNFNALCTPARIAQVLEHLRQARNSR